MRVGPCESRLLGRMFVPIGSSRPVPLVHLYHELRTRYLPRRGARAGGHVFERGERGGGTVFGHVSRRGGGEGDNYCGEARSPGNYVSSYVAT